MQTLGAIRIQLYHQCFEQVWQHNFTSIIGLRRSTQRHRSSKVGTSIVDLRKSTHRSSMVDTSIIDLRRSTHRSSKIEGGNIAPTTQHRADIPTIRHRILFTTALHNYLSPRFCAVYTYCIPYSGYFSGGKTFVDMENFAGSWKKCRAYVYVCTNGRGSLHLW